MTDRKPHQLLKMFAITMAILVVIALSPLTDSDTGWQNTVGDVVWTGMFVTFAGIVAAAAWSAVTAVRNRDHSALR